jgi:cytidine deaminase
LREFGPDIVVLVADRTGAYRETTVGELLPDSFSATDLEQAGAHARTAS